MTERLKMDQEMAMTLAIGMLENEGLKYNLRPDKKEAVVHWVNSSTFVSTEVGTVSNKVFVTFTTPLVTDFRLTDKNRLKAYEWVNEKNSRFRSCRFSLVPETPKVGAKSSNAHVRMEYELLADNLHQAEFSHVLNWIGLTAEKLDGEFIADFGGKTHKESVEARQKAPKPFAGTVAESVET